MKNKQTSTAAISEKLNVCKANRPHLQKNHVLMVNLGKCLREKIVATENKWIWHHHAYNPHFQKMTTRQLLRLKSRNLTVDLQELYENEMLDRIAKSLETWRMQTFLLMTNKIQTYAPCRERAQMFVSGQVKVLRWQNIESSVRKAHFSHCLSDLPTFFRAYNVSQCARKDDKQQQKTPKEKCLPIMLVNEYIKKEKYFFEMIKLRLILIFFSADAPVRTAPARRQKHCTNIWWLLNDLR